jgi:hypothetical protein
LQLVVEGKIKPEQVDVCLWEKSLGIELLGGVFSEAVGDNCEDGFGGFLGFRALGHVCRMR